MTKREEEYYFKRYRIKKEMVDIMQFVVVVINI